MRFIFCCSLLLYFCGQLSLSFRFGSYHQRASSLDVQYQKGFIQKVSKVNSFKSGFDFSLPDVGGEKSVELFQNVISTTPLMKPLITKCLKFEVQEATWLEEEQIVSLRVSTFFPSVCEGNISNQSMKNRIAEKMKQRSNEGAKCFIAKEFNGVFYSKVIGTVEISPSDFRGTALDSIGADQKLYLTDLAIKSDFKRKGVARGLLESVEEYALEHDYKEIYMHVEKKNLIARSLYTKYGYIEAQTSYRNSAFTEKIMDNPNGHILLLKSL